MYTAAFLLSSQFFREGGVAPKSLHTPSLCLPPQPVHGPGSTRGTLKYRGREMRRLNVIHKKMYSYSVNI